MSHLRSLAARTHLDGVRPSVTQSVLSCLRIPGRTDILTPPFCGVLDCGVVDCGIVDCGVVELRRRGIAAFWHWGVLPKIGLAKCASLSPVLRPLTDVSMPTLA